MHTGAVVGIQDMGAAGLTCSTCEMASRGGTGIEIDLALVPQRETGMTPYEIMLSESQERMLLVVEKGREDEVFRVFKKWGLDAVSIGAVTADGKMRVRDRGQVVAEIPARELADEAPLYDRPHTLPFRAAPIDGPPIPEGDPEADLVALVGSGDLCSKRWIWEQYDHMVRRGRAATRPSCASRKPALRSPWRSTAAAVTPTSPRARAPGWPWRSAAATSRPPARCPWPRPTA